jgi:hypothetical protein
MAEDKFQLLLNKTGNREGFKLKFNENTSMTNDT